MNMGLPLNLVRMNFYLNHVNIYYIYMNFYLNHVTKNVLRGGVTAFKVTVGETKRM